MYVRAGLPFSVMDGPLLADGDDSTEVCGVRILGQSPIDIINIYRPPIRSTNDEREDRFEPCRLPATRQTLLVGDVNAHHPDWDNNCEEEDAVGARLASWMEDLEWTTLNSGDPTLISYRTGGQTAPDLAACSQELATRASWSRGPDLGSDHLPMVVELRGVSEPPQRRRKTRWAHHKADWLQFRGSCEAALAEPPLPEATVQQLSSRFTAALQEAGKRHIPRGARRDAKPWALHPDVLRAAEERQAARRAVTAEDPSSKTRWINAKKRAAEVEARVSRESFREFVTTELNRPSSVGRVSRMLKKWEGGGDDEHRDGEAMKAGDRLLVSAEAKANAFAHQYATVSRQRAAAPPRRPDEAGAEGVTVEPRLEVPLLPWTTCRPIAFNLDVGPGGRRASSNETRREAARQHLAALPAQATWIWSDGSADAGVRRGGGGAVIFTASGETLEVEVAAGGLCSSTRAELFALRAALERVRDEPSPAPLVACSDSRAALSLLSAGAAAQTTTIGAAIWRTLLDIAERRQVTLQWVPAHCGLAENERADALAKQAATLPQGAVPSDARSLTRAVHRTATRQWRENWPDSFFKTIFGSTLPLPIPGEDREAAISVHQLRAGHWGRSLQYLHRIGRHPSVACLQCPDKRCPAALCAVCREEADVPEHVLLRCPALAGARLRLTGSIYVDPSRLRDADLVAALEAGYLRHREPLGYGPP
ncbi:Ribonuclease HI [Amphibalanus amphitrite]|uniref:Ribonuclease HI n=1 Tax=Amphibalanus amphitrite TaxID=1232801 RepID=A0A6A4XG37_AMPAM|nr:Ribonuclease HI [Amphibalanus amphitrite]